MSKESGFLQLRRGLWEHIRDGRMSHMEALAFIYIASQADSRTGIWKGCAKSLSGELAIAERTARDLLEKMEHADYIRRFAVPGRHVCYPILIHKFPISQGEHNGEHLNATESISPADLRYFPREHSVKHRGERGAAQRIQDTIDRKRKPAAKSARPADPRFQAFVDFAFRSYQRKHGQAPNWAGKDFKNLTDLLRKNQTLTLSELARRWNHYTASTEPFTEKQGDSLAYFCTKFDSFIDGPILTGPSGGNGSAKLTGTELARHNAAALGFTNGKPN